MARVRIMYWKEIPYGVRAQDDDGQVTRQLPAEFQESIDTAAMLSGETSAEDYQARFRWGPVEDRPGAAAEAADAAVVALIEAYPAARLEALARGEG
jgi:hypothetical protein